jgi:ubiquinone biosynthesis protein COQ9
MPSPGPADLTLDELRPLLGAALPADAAFDGWSARALEATAARIGVDPKVAALAFPGGAVAMIDAWFATVDDAMRAACPADAMAKLKIRQRIATLVEARLTVLAPNREALRRAQAVLASPFNAAAAARLGWRAADAMWRQAGDTATDYNHYTKRAILSGVYAATLMVFVNDESEGWADTRAFLARRIEGVMQFEKVKARILQGRELAFSPARFLGRLRYPGA